jgi:hypothetical protein
VPGLVVPGSVFDAVVPLPVDGELSPSLESPAPSSSSSSSSSEITQAAVGSNEHTIEASTAGRKKWVIKSSASGRDPSTAPIAPPARRQ